jgi:UDP-N-acetylglucosamine acyltransferase
MMIHPTALIDSNAKIDSDVNIGPFCVIGGDVKIDDGCEIGAYTFLNHVKLSRDCKIGTHCAIGSDPQIYDWKPVDSWVEIGANSIVNELTAIHRSMYEGKATIIGARSYIMTQTHVGHDCILGDGVTLTSMAGLSGHVEVGDNAVIGGFVGVHQFVRIGEMAMVGGMSRISQDVAPYFLVTGVPAQAKGLNSYALKKYKMEPEERKNLKKAYKLLVRSKLSLSNAIERIVSEIPMEGAVARLVEFVRQAKRGVTL